MGEVAGADRRRGGGAVGRPLHGIAALVLGHPDSGLQAKAEPPGDGPVVGGEICLAWSDLGIRVAVAESASNRSLRRSPSSEHSR